MSVALSKRLAEMHTGRGQIYVAAPVFGRPEAAAAARLWVVAAGANEDLARCQPLFDAIGRGSSIVGKDPWLANVFKLSGNFLIAAALESIGEAFALVRKSGGDAAQFLGIVNEAVFNSPVYTNYGGAVAKEQFEPAGFKLKLGFRKTCASLRKLPRRPRCRCLWPAYCAIVSSPHWPARRAISTGLPWHASPPFNPACDFPANLALDSVKLEARVTLPATTRDLSVENYWKL